MECRIDVETRSVELTKSRWRSGVEATMESANFYPLGVDTPCDYQTVTLRVPADIGVLAGRYTLTLKD